MAPPTDPDAARRGRRVYWLGFVLVLVVLVVAGWTARMFGYFGQPLAWRFTARWAALVAAVLVLLALVLTHWAVRLSPGTPERPSAAELAGLGDAGRAARIRDFRRSGVKGLVMGADGRASTSLVQVTLWTVALGYALLMLLLLGRSPNCPVAAPRGGRCCGRWTASTGTPAPPGTRRCPRRAARRPSAPTRGHRSRRRPRVPGPSASWPACATSSATTAAGVRCSMRSTSRSPSSQSGTSCCR